MSQSLAVLEAVFNEGTTSNLTEIPPALFNTNDMFSPVLVRGSEKPSAGFGPRQIIFYGIIFFFGRFLADSTSNSPWFVVKRFFGRGNKGFQYRRIGQYP